MSHAAPPALTVRYDGSQRTFAAGHDIVVGRDLRADMRITHPLISRAHLLLRFDQGRWLAIDNGSLNGTYVHGRRVPVIDIHDGQAINIGNPDGPQLSFEIGRHQGAAGRPPQTTSMPMAKSPVAARPAPAPQHSRPAPGRGRKGPSARGRHARIQVPRQHRATKASARRLTHQARNTRRHRPSGNRPPRWPRRPR